MRWRRSIGEAKGTIDDAIGVVGRCVGEGDMAGRPGAIGKIEGQDVALHMTGAR